MLTLAHILASKNQFYRKAPHLVMLEHICNVNPDIVRVHKCLVSILLIDICLKYTNNLKSVIMSLPTSDSFCSILSNKIILFVFFENNVREKKSLLLFITFFITFMLNQELVIKD